MLIAWHIGGQTSLPNRVLDQRISRLPAGIHPDDLRLRYRTRNSLTNAGLLNSLKSLEGLTFRDLLEVRNFGVRSLVDLLRALEFLAPQRGNARKPGRADFRALQKEARKLRDTKHAGKVSREDPRFWSILRQIDYRARDARHAADRIVSSACKLADADPSRTAKRIYQLRRRIESLSKLKLEDELWDLTTVLTNERDRRIALRRFGWDGNEPASLRATGDLFRVSHEYARVICNRLVQSFEGKKVFAPALDRVLEFIANHAEHPEHFERELLSSGLVRNRFSLKSLISASSVLGRDDAVELLIEMGPGNLLEGKIVRQQALSASHHCLKRWGVTSVSQVQSHFRQKTGDEIDPGVLAEIPGFRWLDPTSGWFCLDQKNSPLANRIRRALAVARRLTVSELREVVARHQYRTRRLDLPGHVLLEFCRPMPWCLTKENHVVAVSTLRWKDVLPRGQRTVVEVLKEHGPILSWARIRELCLARGMKSHTVESIVCFSPVTAKLGGGAWGLLGAKVPIETLRRVQRESRPVSNLFIKELKVEERSRLESGLSSSNSFARRCRVILASAGGATVSEIAASSGYSFDRVRRLIHNFEKDAGAFLDKRPRDCPSQAKRERGGQPKRATARQIFDAATTAELQRLVAQTPGDFGKEQTRWTGPVLMRVCLERGLIPRPVTPAAIYKALRASGIHLSKQKDEATFPVIKLLGRTRLRLESESGSPDRATRLRALILLARARGESQRYIARSLACSPGTVRRTVRAFAQLGLK